MADERIRVDIESSYDDDDAKQALKDAEKIDKADPTLEVDADTSDAESGIKAVRDDAEKLTGKEWVAKVLADTAAAKADLEALQAEAGDTGTHLSDSVEEGSGKARDAVHGFVGEAALELPGVADAVGPAGEAFGQLTEGILAGEVAMGELLTAAVPLVALTGVVKLISGYMADIAATKAFRSEQVQTFVDLIEDGATSAGLLRKELEKTGALQWVKDGDVKDATAAFVDLGLTVEDYTRFVNDPSLMAGLQATFDDLQAKMVAQQGLRGQEKQDYADLQAVLTAVKQKHDDIADATEKAGDKQKFYGEQIAETTGLQREYARAQGEANVKQARAQELIDDTTDAYDRLSDRLSNRRAIEDWQAAMIEAQKAIHDKSADTVVDIRGVEDAILAAGQAAHLNPIVVNTAIEKADQGDIDGAFLYMQQKINEQGPLEVKVALHATIPKLKIAGRGGTQIVVEVDPTSSSSVAAGAGTTNVFLPRGYRGDVVAQATGAARRNGRRYGTHGTVRYARR